MPSVITVGEVLVEVMRAEPDVSLREVGKFVGPFPSGAPAIFVDAAARLGADAAIIGAVGDDEFGQCVADRLRADGVDISGLATTDRLSTGVAFVTYRSDGSRRFIYHMANAASGTVEPSDVPVTSVAEADALHVNGSSLSMGASMRAACHVALDVAVEHDLVVSFDPNIRPELLSTDETREVFDHLLEKADIVVPTEAELKALSLSADDTASRAERLIDQGASTVAVTRGDDGCTVFTSTETADHPGFDVDPVDPTGAGDAFSAAMVLATLEGQPIPERAAFANAAGARATTAQGPMEGLARRDEIDALIGR